MKTLVINTDGGSRGNPGPSAAGVALVMGEASLYHNRYLGETTNNVAEYSAVLDATGLIAGFIEKHGQPDNIEFRLDSQLVERQLAGLYKIKEPSLQVLATSCRQGLKLLDIPYVFKYVPRAENKIADRLVNEALDAYANN